MTHCSLCKKYIKCCCKKNKFREELFRHLDGIALAPVAYSLKEKGVLDHILTQENFKLEELYNRSKTIGEKIMDSSGNQNLIRIGQGIFRTNFGVS